MRLSRSIPVPIVSPAPSFEAIREVTAVVGRHLRVPTTAPQVMRAATLRCQKGGPTRTGSECLDCERLVSIKPSPGRSSVTIRCLWTEVDAVDAVMTRAHAVVTVTAAESRGRADEIAARAHVHHLIVLDGRGQVIGTICRCKLAEPGSPAGQYRVAEFLEDAWTIPSDTTLAEAADAMERLDVGILLVADDDELLGLVTPRDLGLLEGHAS